MNSSLIYPLRFLSLVLCLLLFPLPVGAQDPQEREAKKQKNQKGLQKEELENYFDRWLDQDVVYVISQQERAVFKGLSTDEEKEQFIEQFWYRRDPDPRTPSNQFKEEHYRRIAYANEHYTSGIPGWKSDRGQIYIIHGKPAEVEKHFGGQSYQRPTYEGGGMTSTAAFEIWRYRFIEGIGTDVEMEFVDPSGSGEFRFARNPWEKDLNLFKIGSSPTIAEEIGYAERGDHPYFSPYNQDRLPGMSYRAKDNPFTRYETQILLGLPGEPRFPDLKQIVDINVTYNNLGFRTRSDYFRLNEIRTIVPFSIELDNQDLTFKEENGKYVARVGLYGLITSISNRVIGEFEEDLEIGFTAEEMVAGRQARSAYQHVLTLENKTRYKMDVVVKDLNSEQVGVQRVALIPPRLSETELALSSLLLSHSIEWVRDLPKEERFIIGDLKIQPNLKHEFRADQPFGAYFQIYNAKVDQASYSPSLAVAYRIRKEGKLVKYWKDEAGESVQFFSPQRVVMVKPLPITTLGPGRYRVEIEVTDRLSNATAAVQRDFTIAAPAEAPQPTAGR